MNRFIRDNATALLLALASVILAAAFCLPVGGERQASTQYQRLAGFVDTFETPQSVESSGKGGAPTRGETWGLVAQAVRQKYTPVQADALLSRVESFSKDTNKTAQHRGRIKAHKSVATTATSTATSSAPVVPDAMAAIPASETADSVSERYENDLSKYPLDATVAQGVITLSLQGLSRAGDRCILSVAVTNHGGDDFFVREFVVRDRQDILAAKFYVRLFIEPGRTREGFVVFDKPRAGASVHVALKEDRENGRVVELPVTYPF